MKVLAILVLACSGGLAAEACAQGTASRTYFGWDGPPQFGGNTFIANTYGNTIEILPRNDQCGRTYFIRGVLSVAPNLNRGTIAGTMRRCSSRELIVSCEHAPSYETGFSGTVIRDETHRRLTLHLTYTMEIWNEETCKKERNEPQTEIIQLLYQPPTGPAPTTTQQLGDIADDSRQIAFDSFWTLGGLSPR